MNMFADDAKIQKKVITENSCLEFQNDLTKLFEWSRKWQIEFNTEKCHVIKFGKSGIRPNREYKLGNYKVQESDREKDLGLVINNRLSPEDHIKEKVKNMNNLLANMRVAFTYIDEEMIKKIITSFIHPTFEYAAVIWNPYLKKKT